jgi:hypothetical protein
MRDIENSANLKIIHVNIRSMRMNWELLQWNIKETNIKWDIIVLTEINIKKGEVNNYNWKNYVHIAETRESTTRGGGVMIYISENLKMEERSPKKIKIEQNEVLVIDFHAGNLNFKLVAIYRRPTTDKKKFIKALKIFLNDIKHVGGIIVIGDMNIDILKSENDDKDKYEQNVIDKYENTMASLGYENIIDSPTREEVIMLHKQNIIQQSCIDHIYVKNDRWETKGGTLTKKIADHYMTMCWMWNTEIVNNTEEQEEETKFIKYNHKGIIKSLNELKWDCINGEDCPNLMYEMVNQQIKEIYKKNKTECIATNKKGKNKGRKEWITEEIINLIDKKNNLWKQIKGAGIINQDLIVSYREAKKFIDKEIIRRKQTYYLTRLDYSKKENKNVWEVINEMTGKENKKKNIDETIIKTFKETELTKLRNDFNNNFTNQVPKLKEKFKRRLDNYRQGYHYQNIYKIKKKIMKVMFKQCS